MCVCVNEKRLGFACNVLHNMLRVCVFTFALAHVSGMPNLKSHTHTHTNVRTSYEPVRIGSHSYTSRYKYMRLDRIIHILEELWRKWRRMCILYVCLILWKHHILALLIYKPQKSAHTHTKHRTLRAISHLLVETETRWISTDVVARVNRRQTLISHN